MALFFFNHGVAHFGVPLQLVSNHISHLEDVGWKELSAMLKFEQKNFSTYYPQGNVKVEFVNKILKNVGQTQDQMEQLSLFCPLGLPDID